jgi:hypothetical protein
LAARKALNYIALMVICLGVSGAGSLLVELNSAGVNRGRAASLGIARAESEVVALALVILNRLMENVVGRQGAQSLGDFLRIASVVSERLGHWHAVERGAATAGHD